MDLPEEAPVLAHPLLGTATRPLLALAGAGAVAWAWWRHREPLGAWAIAGTAFVLLTPTAHPWYVLWALVPSLIRGRWGWAAAAVPLLGSYAVLGHLDVVTGAWQEPWWLPWITWGPALGCLLAEAAWRAGPGAPGRPGPRSGRPGRAAPAPPGRRSPPRTGP